MFNIKIRRKALRRLAKLDEKEKEKNMKNRANFRE